MWKPIRDPRESSRWGIGVSWQWSRNTILPLLLRVLVRLRICWNQWRKTIYSAKNSTSHRDTAVLEMWRWELNYKIIKVTNADLFQASSIWNSPVVLLFSTVFPHSILLVLFCSDGRGKTDSSAFSLQRKNSTQWDKRRSCVCHRPSRSSFHWHWRCWSDLGSTS